MYEFESIPYVRVKGIRIFINKVMYRTPHFHKSLELMMILSGEMEVYAEHKKYKLYAHDIVLINSGSPHEITAGSPGCTFLCLQLLPTSYLSNFPSVMFEATNIKECISEKQFSQISILMLNMALKYFHQDDFFEVYCVSTTNRILYLLLSALPHHKIFSVNSRQEQMSARLMRLVDYVDQTYMNRPSLGEFAESEGMSISYISRFAKSVLNQNFQSYVNTVRFYAACRLIATGTLSMLDVCYEVGFSDYRYFSKEFRERTGLTPAQYKQMEINAVHKSSDYSLEHIFSDEDSAKLLEDIIRKNYEKKEFVIE